MRRPRRSSPWSTGWNKLCDWRLSSSPPRYQVQSHAAVVSLSSKPVIEAQKRTKPALPPERLFSKPVFPSCPHIGEFSGRHQKVLSDSENTQTSLGDSVFMDGR